MVIGGRFFGLPGADGAGENGSSSSSEPEPFAARLVVNSRSGGRVQAACVGVANWQRFGSMVDFWGAYPATPETGQRDEGD
jgi:hypothetical protein